MVARVPPERCPLLEASSKPIFCQLTEFPVIDRILLALTFGCRVEVFLFAEALSTFFDSLIKRSLLRLTPLREALLLRGVSVDLSGVRALRRFIGRRLLSFLGAAIGSDSTFELRAVRCLGFFDEDRFRGDSLRTSCS